MKKITWNDLESMDILECTIGRWMDIVEEETGNFPKWNEQIPQWVNKLI